ncbi:hypothetical protein QTP88_022552 [Uroleucon formosanum]
MIRKTTVSGTSQSVPSGNRSYSTDFIKFGFRHYEINKVVQPQCIICGERLANERLLKIMNLILLPEHKTTDADIYSSLDNIFLQNNIQWTNCVGVTTDGAASMMSKHIYVLHMQEEDSANVDDIKTIISLHLNQISIALNSYFPKDIRDDFQWIENPFTVSIHEMNFNKLLETQIIELSCDKTYENKLKNETLVDFWCVVPWWEILCNSIQNYHPH